MQIAKDTVVSLTYQLFDTDGKLIEQTEQPVSYLHGGHHGMFAPVQRALEGKEAGYTCSVRMEPEDAFGEYDATLVRLEPRDAFPSKLQMGMQFEGRSGESDETRVYRVTDIAKGKVVVDGNHPLAGQTLVFNCVVTDVRPASNEELSHGHVHGAGGHHH